MSEKGKLKGLNTLSSVLMVSSQVSTAVRGRRNSLKAPA